MSGLSYQVLLTGSVPSDTNVELSGSIVPLDIIIFELPANGIGVCWKHSSVSSDPSGQSRNCQPPPVRARRQEGVEGERGRERERDKGKRRYMSTS